MNFLAKLFSSGVGDLFKQVIEEFKLAPEKKAEMEMQLSQLQAQAEQADRDLEGKLNDIAGQNIRAETTSADAFVRRARPFFIWAIGAAVSLNIFLPLINNFFGGHMKPLDIDPSAYGLFATCILGYTAARTTEKIKGVA